MICTSVLQRHAIFLFMTFTPAHERTTHLSIRLYITSIPVDTTTTGVEKYESGGQVEKTLLPYAHIPPFSFACPAI